ncbi:MAG: hypothetical protein EOO52_13495 [Gammaproteobacteria bacterium]|nr:MAG: hypothetical protein EOO52_13495 [Gammaproteobacteria bacterium]
MTADYYSRDAIIGRTQVNYSLAEANNNEQANNAVRALDLGQVRADIQNKFELIQLLLDEQYSLLAVEAKIAHVDFADSRKERHANGGKYGYLCTSVVCFNKVLSCRFYKREPYTNAGKMFKRSWLNPGKTRKVSYRALQKASGDSEELRLGMVTEVTFRLIREACIDVSKMRARVKFLLSAFEERKGIREVFKIDPRDIVRPEVMYRRGA